MGRPDQATSPSAGVMGVGSGQLSRHIAAVLAQGVDFVRSPIVRSVVIGVALFLSFGAMAWTLLTAWPAITTAEWTLEPARLLAAFTLQIVATAIATRLWFSIASHLGASRPTAADVRGYAYSVLSRRIPGAPWHVVGRLAHYADVGLGRRVGIGGSSIEWGLAMATGTCFWLALTPSLAPYGAIAAIAALAALPFVAAAIMRPRRPTASLSRALVRWTAYDLLGWAAGCGAMYFLFTGLHPFPTDALAGLISSTAAAYVASMVVVFLPSGLGLREISLAALTTEFVTWPIAVTLAISGRALTLVADSVWVVVLILSTLRSAQSADRGAAADRD